MTVPPIHITGVVVGAERTVLRLRARGDRAREIVRRHVQRAGIGVQNVTKFDYLSGQALHKRTGRLINSINEQTVDAGNLITSTVGTKVSYGRFWELGFHGTEHVREHIRRMKGGNIKQGRKITALGIGFVRAHDRRVNQSARPFLKPALAKSRPAITREMNAAVAEVAKLSDAIGGTE